MYFFTLNRSWCFCGNSMQHPVMNGKESESSCNSPCPGNKIQICGATGMNSIYETGVESNFFAVSFCW